MQFHTFGFVFAFLPLALLSFYLLRGSKARNFVLVLFSFTFYGWAEPWAVVLLLLSSIVDYRLGALIYRHDAPRSRRRYLIASLIFNLSLLAFFKYWDWLAGAAGFEGLKHGLAVPPGISFYTFQTLSYTIDIYRRQFKPRGHFIDYLAFISFFPHLVAGPIMRARDLLPNLVRHNQRIKPRHVEGALFLIGWGIFKKLVFADNFGHLVDRSRDNLDTPGAGLVLALAFTMQIYCDFSAYSDIARGSARLFGIRLWRNFLTPYFARNPSDFWRRWHITLSTWVRDYVYIPLGGSRHGLARTALALIVTMFIMGLWHGAGVFFILWGLYHGLLLAFWRVCPLDRILIRALGRNAGTLISILIMFTLIVFGWILFWTQEPAQFTGIMRSIGTLVTIGAEPMTWKLAYGLLLFALPVMLTEALGYLRHVEFVDLHKRWPMWARVPIYVVMMYGLVFFGSRGSYDFIYFQF